MPKHFDKRDARRSFWWLAAWLPACLPNCPSLGADYDAGSVDCTTRPELAGCRTGGTTDPGSGGTPATGSFIDPGSGGTPATGSFIDPGSGGTPATGSFIDVGSGGITATGSFIDVGGGGITATGSVPETGGSTLTYAEAYEAYLVASCACDGLLVEDCALSTAEERKCEADAVESNASAWASCWAAAYGAAAECYEVDGCYAEDPCENRLAQAGCGDLTPESARDAVKACYVVPIECGLDEYVPELEACCIPGFSMTDEYLCDGSLDCVGGDDEDPLNCPF